MKNNIITIMKKELRRLFGDKNLVFSGVILQGLLLYVMYTLMGSFIGNIASVDEAYSYRISVINMPESISGIIEASDIPFEVTIIADENIAAEKEKIDADEADLLIRFPADFDEAVAVYDVTSALIPAPHIQIWYNGGTMMSLQAEGILRSLLYEYESTMAKKFDINADAAEVMYDLNTGTDFAMNIMMSMVPMLLITIIYSSCLTVAPESIAGEKERGTLATMLATPARRRDMALAKVVAISIFGVFGAAVTFIAMMLSLPNLMGVSMDTEIALMSSYTIADYIMILAIIISTVLVFISILSVMSAYAKSVKQANAYATPFMIVSMALGLSSLVTNGAVTNTTLYMIPIFNSAQSMTGVLNNEMSVINIIVTIVANVVFSLIFVGIIAKMFGSEKIIFDK